MAHPDMETYIHDAFADAGFSSGELAIFSSLFDVKTFTSKDIIMKQGDLAQGLYIMVNGALDVTIRIPGSLPKQIALTGRNIFFGEISLVEANIATATVQAAKDTLCLFLSAKKYRALAVIYPDIDLKVIITLNTIILSRIIHNVNEIARSKAEFTGIGALDVGMQAKTALSKQFLHQEQVTISLLRFLGLFNEFNDDELLLLLTKMKGLLLKKDTLLSKRADYYRSSWLIIRGAMQVLVANPKGGSQLMIMPPGKMLDTELLTRLQGKLYCKAQNDLLLFCLDEDAIDSLRREHPSLYYRYLKSGMLSLAQFFTTTNKKLAQIDSGC